MYNKITEFFSWLHKYRGSDDEDLACIRGLQGINISGNFILTDEEVNELIREFSIQDAVKYSKNEIDKKRLRGDNILC
jgi:hypothetical protein